MYSADVMEVVRTIGTGVSREFRTSGESASVVRAADASLCRIVPYKGHEVVLVDVPHNETKLGLELTAAGADALKQYEGVAR